MSPTPTLTPLWPRPHSGPESDHLTEPDRTPPTPSPASHQTSKTKATLKREQRLRSRKSVLLADSTPNLPLIATILDGFRKRNKARPERAPCSAPLPPHPSPPPQPCPPPRPHPSPTHHKPQAASLHVSSFPSRPLPTPIHLTPHTSPPHSTHQPTQGGAGRGGPEAALRADAAERRGCGLLIAPAERQQGPPPQRRERRHAARRASHAQPQPRRAVAARGARAGGGDRGATDVDESRQHVDGARRPSEGPAPLRDLAPRDLAPRASRLAPHSSPLAPRASRLAPRASPRPPPIAPTPAPTPPRPHPRAHTPAPTPPSSGARTARGQRLRDGGQQEGLGRHQGERHHNQAHLRGWLIVRLPAPPHRLSAPFPHLAPRPSPLAPRPSPLTAHPCR